jgi:hypothetical protein
MGDLGFDFSALPFSLSLLRTMGTRRISSVWLNAHLFFWPPPVSMGRLSFGMSSQATYTAS